MYIFVPDLIRTSMTDRQPPQNIWVSGIEAAEYLGLDTRRFLQMQDKGLISPELFKSGVMYDLRKLKKVETSKIVPYRSGEFPSNEYASVQQALDMLGISRRTFYIRVDKGVLVLHRDKVSRRSYVKLTDLY